ncbi:uncharacterized protein [Procambarus clarkii]|uniref:uncharacterized protein n=1 Tax=Procambarus clarkii TaxID=6728 RepID=UPI0037448C85
MRDIFHGICRKADMFSRWGFIAVVYLTSGAKCSIFSTYSRLINQHRRLVLKSVGGDQVVMARASPRGGPSSPRGASPHTVFPRFSLPHPAPPSLATLATPCPSPPSTPAALPFATLHTGRPLPLATLHIGHPALRHPTHWPPCPSPPSTLAALPVATLHTGRPAPRHPPHWPPCPSPPSTPAALPLATLHTGHPLPVATLHTGRPARRHPPHRPPCPSPPSTPATPCPSPPSTPAALPLATLHTCRPAQHIKRIYHMRCAWTAAVGAGKAVMFDRVPALV